MSETEVQHEVYTTQAGAWNDLGWAPLGNSVISSSIILKCKYETFELHPSSKILTTAGVKKVSDVSVGDELPVTITPSSYFDSSEELLPIPEAVNDNGERVKCYSQLAFKLFQLFGVLSHWNVVRTRVQEYFSLPLNFGDSSIIFQTKEGAKRFYLCCTQA
jgi:hypothetical protein